MILGCIKARTVAIRLCMHFFHALNRRDRDKVLICGSDMHPALQLRQKGVIRDLMIRRAACNRRREKPPWYQRLVANRSAQQWLTRNTRRHVSQNLLGRGTCTARCNWGQMTKNSGLTVSRKALHGASRSLWHRG